MVSSYVGVFIASLAHIGVVVLIDEATGYQYIRDRIALQTILDRYIKDEWSKWTKRLPSGLPSRSPWRAQPGQNSPRPLRPSQIRHACALGGEIWLAARPNILTFSRKLKSKSLYRRKCTLNHRGGVGGACV